MTKIFYDRKDLLIGSLIAAALGPFAISPTIDSMQSFLADDAQGQLLMVFGAVCYIYVLARTLIDIASDVVEWKAVPKLMATTLREYPSEVKHPDNVVKVVLLMLEAIVFGGGTIAFLVLDPSRPHLLPELNLAMFGQISIAIGALTLYERNIAFVYPFHFLNWLGLRSFPNDT